MKKVYVCEECLHKCVLHIHGAEEGACNLENSKCCPQRSYPVWHLKTVKGMKA